MTGFLTTRKRTERDHLGRILAVTAVAFMAAAMPAQAQTSPTQASPAQAKPTDSALNANASANPAAANADTPKSDAVASTTPSADPKADEAKPTEAKPAEAKPAEPAATAEPAKTTPVTAPAAGSVATSDQPVADKLKEMIAGKSLKLFDSKGERAAVEAFYTARNFAPLWSESGKAAARTTSAIARLKAADTDGLDAAEYPTPDFAAATTPDLLAAAELRLTASVLDYARHAYSGRMHYSRVTADIYYPEHPLDPADVLAKVAGAGDMAAALDSYNPPHAGYKALKSKLAELRGQTETPPPQMAEGPALKVNKKKPMEDDRVPAVRARLGVTENTDSKVYDAAVADAVKKFQKTSELAVNGVYDNATVRALNGPKKDRIIDLVRINMERWRWLPRELGEAKLGNAYVMLNIPDFTLKVMQNGAQTWTTRVVTGKPGKHATPMLTETMKFITVNPTWNVPPSIVYNEYLPALKQDPTVLQRMGLKLTQNRDGSVHIAQPPGAGNALGRIRFNFPNKFLVYQHDTPDKHLFAHDVRAYSHGCMRIQNPDQYAEALLKIALPNDKYSAEKIRGMYGTSEMNINFPTPIPVHITYQSAFVDDAGKLEIRKDIYGRDARMLELIRGKERASLEVAINHAQPSYGRPSVSLPDGFGSNSGPSFLERLFGGGQPEPAPQPRRRRAAANR